MSRERPDVVRTVLWHIPNTEHIVPSTMQWSRKDPHAVYILFHDYPEDRVWTFGRELLSNALVTGMGGEGDITFIRGGDELRPSGRTLLLESAEGDRLWCFLSSPDGTGKFATGVNEVIDFLNATTLIVPIGLEWKEYDISSEIEALLHLEGE